MVVDQITYFLAARCIYILIVHRVVVDGTRRCYLSGFVVGDDGIFLRVVITYCQLHGTTSIQFLIILFGNEVPVHLHNPVTPFQPDFRGRASVGNVKNLCNNGIIFSFYFYPVGGELESVAVIRIGDAAGSGDADQAVDGGELVLFGFERGKESERGLEIVQVVGMGNVVYPIVPHTHGIVNPAVCLGLSGILLPAVHPAGSQIDGKNKDSQYEYQCISCFHGGKDSAN